MQFAQQLHNFCLTPHHMIIFGQVISEANMLKKKMVFPIVFCLTSWSCGQLPFDFLLSMKARISRQSFNLLKAAVSAGQTSFPLSEWKQSESQMKKKVEKKVLKEVQKRYDEISSEFHSFIP